MGATLFFHAAALAVVDGSVPRGSFGPQQRIEPAGPMRHVKHAAVRPWQICFCLHPALPGALVMWSGLGSLLPGVGRVIEDADCMVDSVHIFAVQRAWR